jgi:hypothetical protein
LKDLKEDKILLSKNSKEIQKKIMTKKRLKPIIEKKEYSNLINMLKYGEPKIKCLLNPFNNTEIFEIIKKNKVMTLITTPRLKIEDLKNKYCYKMINCGNNKQKIYEIQEKGIKPRKYENLAKFFDNEEEYKSYREEFGDEAIFFTLSSDSAILQLRSPYAYLVSFKIPSERVSKKYLNINAIKPDSYFGFFTIEPPPNISIYNYVQHKWQSLSELNNKNYIEFEV